MDDVLVSFGVTNTMAKSDLGRIGFASSFSLYSITEVIWNSRNWTQSDKFYKFSPTWRTVEETPEFERGSVREEKNQRRR